MSSGDEVTECDDILDECSFDEEHHESVCADSSRDTIDMNESDNMSDGEVSDGSTDSSDEFESDDELIIASKDGRKWYKKSLQLPSQNIKSTESNISDHKIVLPSDTHIENPEDAFFLYFNDFIFTEIVKYTNIEAERNVQKWKVVDVIEMRAFFGLLLTAGHLKQNNTSYVTLWSKKYRSPIFRATMSLDRFKLLLRFIRFDDKETRATRRATDKLAAIRNIFEECNKMFAKYYVPGSFLTVDEQMVGW